MDEFKDNSKNAGDVLAQPSKYANEVSELFGKFVFFIGREVPVDILEFVILSAGGKVISEAAIDELENSKAIDLSSVTHQIVDRPKILKKVQGRTYIQPQWIFDCVNKSTLLNASDYAPGETLPPHLSPWGDAGTYDPEAPLEEGDEEEEEEENEDDEEADVRGEDEENVEEDEDLTKQKELELEMSGVKSSALSQDQKKSNKRKHGEVGNKEDEDEKNLKMIMMSNKQRKLYKKMQYGLNKHDVRKAELEKKRKLLSKRKQELSKLAQN